MHFEEIEVIGNYARACGSQGTSPCPVSVSASWGTESYSQVSPSVVVDGVAGSANPTLAHSDGLVANEWLMVDLQKQRSIMSVTIYNRIDAPDFMYSTRLTDAEIRVGDANTFNGNTACATISTADVATSRKIDKRCSVLGRCDVSPAYLRESSVRTRTVCLLLFL